jgi:hypothetical protein
MSCGVTETFFGNKVADIVGSTYKIGPDAGAEAVAMRQLPVMRGGQCGGCGCMAGLLPKKTVKGGKRRSGIKRSGATKRQRGGYGGCTGQPTMLRALGLMNGGKRLTTGGRYKPTAKDRAALRRFRAGKSIGFTMCSSLKAKGLIPRANGTRRVSNKYLV